MLYPATMFCCGCPVSYGVFCILFFHLLACCLYVGGVVSSIIFHVPSVGSTWPIPLQFCLVALYLCGIPVVLCAAYGVMKRIEAPVRIYLYYLFLCFVVNCVLIIAYFLIKDACNDVDPEKNVVNVFAETVGAAFLCGVLRIGAWLAAAGIIAMEVYCLFAVWSFCEDVHCGKTGPCLSELEYDKETKMKMKYYEHRGDREGPYAGIVGLAHSRVPGPYPEAYGAVSTIGMPLQGTIFHGTKHETNYPPPPEAGVF